jgi:glycosyltransferase involved in cell wall biosynthesis
VGRRFMTAVSVPPEVLVNLSYAMQRVTGQQRYAREIAQRLLQDDQFKPIGPDRFWARSTRRVWAWIQFVLPWLAPGSVLLSMTSRAPWRRRGQVLVVHDLFVLTNPGWFSRRYYLTHAPLLRAQLRSAAAVVAVSQPTADQVASLYRGPIALAPNAPSATFADWDGSDDEVLRRLGLRAQSYFLAVGSLDPRKNLKRLAQAYACLAAADRRAHPLVVVGGGSAVFRQQDLRWPSGTVDAGYVTDEELRQLYRNAHAVVMVSAAEGFGLPLVEAAACGTRHLLVSDIPVFRWICGEGAHYVNPLVVSEIADGMREVLTRPRPQNIDLSRFDWDASAQVIRQVCLRTAAGWQE